MEQSLPIRDNNTVGFLTMYCWLYNRPPGCIGAYDALFLIPKGKKLKGPRASANG